MLKNLLAVTIVLLVLAGLLALGFWYFFLTPKQKAITGLSYYDFPITVTVNNETQEVAPYGNYVFYVTTDASVEAKATDAEGNTLLDKTYDLDRESAVVIEILTPEDELDANAACIVELDATAVYYIDDDVQVTDEYVGSVQNVKVLADSATTSFVHKLGNFKEIDANTVFPGKYSIDDLPTTIDSNEIITGYFAVTCDALNDSEKIRDQVYVWRYFEEGVFDEFDWDSFLEE